MTDGFARTRDAIYAMSSLLGWRVVDEVNDFGPGGEWRLTAYVDTEFGMFRFDAGSDREDVVLHDLWYDGIGAIRTPREEFCNEALTTPA